MSQSLENISLDLLKTLVVFVESGGVDETAKRLKMTQAGVSLQLKKLQNDVGTPLFRTAGRKKVLTDFARDLFQTLAPPLNELEKKLKEVSRFKLEPEKSLLRIGSRPEVMKRVAEKIHFAGRIQFKSLSREQLLQALRDDLLDVAIFQDPPESSQLIAKKIFRNQLCWVGNKQLFPRKHPENYRDLLAQKEILQKAVVTAYKEDPPFLLEFAQKMKFETPMNIRFICEEWNAIVALVADHKTWSIIPEDILVDHKNLITIPLPEDVCKPVDFYAVYGVHLKNSPLIKGLF